MDLTYFCASLRFSTITYLIAFILHCLVKLKILAFCEVFLKLTKLWPPCDNFGEKRLLVFACSVNFSLTHATLVV